MESRASLVWALVFVVGQVACHKFAVPGVPEKLVKHYVGDVFKCLDGSADMPASFVNDNYCDCPDGSDEPATAACDYTFHCADKTLGDVVISTSKLSDGICDCCDGSDEPSGICTNTCKVDTPPMTLLERVQIQQEGMRKSLANS